MDVMSEPRGPVLTAEGRMLLERRVRRLQDVVIPELTRAMRESERDGRDAIEFERATVELHRLMQSLSHARLAEDLPRARGRRRAVRLGDGIELHLPDGGTERYLVVDPVEAPLDEERVSADSPLGAAFLGRRAGDEVVVRAPGHEYRCRLVAWDEGRIIAEVLPGR
jgi:transcription elongation factor GreA